ncbi:hypothetical protein [[Mycobacterium] manitobense]|uniref:hypothetical protein n=1 Tax=[Mycobacterium] manitobense TaxID=190147 RepID=UPI0021F297D6|nr:hypothetical protein [[Mycobacterium] manitobense]
MSQPLPGETPDTGVPQRSRWVSGTALVLAVAALGLSGWALWRTFPGSAADVQYPQAQRDQARQNACAAVDLVRTGVSLNTGEPGPVAPDDVAGSLAAAANARLSLFDGGQYLLARLDPATPTELSDAVHRLADALMDIAAAATAGAQNSDPDQAARLRDADAADAEVRRLCG